MDKLVELGREPTFDDVDLAVGFGGLRSPLPAFLSAFGSTQLVSTDLGIAVSRQAVRLGIPLVVGENVMPVNGYTNAGDSEKALLSRVHAYLDEATPDRGGWASSSRPAGREAGLGGMTSLDADDAVRVATGTS